MKNLPETYPQFLQSIRQTIQAERTRAIQQVSRHLILVYWEIGKQILESQQIHGWGKSVVEQLSKDLRKEYPSKMGYSARNLWFMRQFYESYYEFTNLKQLVSEIPWGHHILIMQKTKSIKEKQYYLKATATMRWSRDILRNQIKANSFERNLELPNQTNFSQTLPEHLQEQANEAIKSEYNLEFLGIRKPLLEQELEQQLIQHLQNFLLELGYGFSFVGRQYTLALGEKNYRVDLLFFHRKLQCLVAIDLKVGAFIPEYAGKMNFYLEILDEQVRLENENPSIGIILCAEKDELVVEYALRTSNKPLGVAEYQLISSLPKELSGQLPTPNELINQLKDKLKK